MMDPSRRRDPGRAALRGATLALAAVWTAVVAFHLLARNWGDAAFWAAIGVATSTGSAVAAWGRRD